MRFVFFPELAGFCIVLWTEKEGDDCQHSCSTSANIDNAISTAHVDYSRYYAPNTFLTSAEKSLYSYNNWSIVNAFERQFGSPGNGYRWVPQQRLRHGVDCRLQGALRL